MNALNTIQNIANDCHVGESRRMLDDSRATIIRFCGEEDIDVVFENGCILNHVNYYDFLNRLLECPVFCDIIDLDLWKRLRRADM